MAEMKSSDGFDQVAESVADGNPAPNGHSNEINHSLDVSADDCHVSFASKNLDDKHGEDNEDKEVNNMHFLHPGEGTPAAMALEANAKLKVSKFDKGLRKIRGIKHPKIKKFKRKKDGRKFSRNFKGKTIEGIHEQYTLTIGMMLGIRVAVTCLV